MDLFRGRIYNWFTFPALISGVAVSFIQFGFSGLGVSLAAVVLGFVLYGWMFWFRIMGGGDIKLLMALGAWGGVKFVAETAILGVALGGVMALILLIFSGRIIDFLKRMYRFFLTLIVKELEFEAPKIDRKFTMPYGIPIAAAAIWISLGDPFYKWGISLW